MNKSVMIVDGESRMRYLISAYLKKEGITVIEVKNEVEAISALRKEKIDLIISDIMMMFMKEYELFTSIPTISDILIVILTLKSKDNDKPLGYELGIADYFIKPFSLKGLTSKIISLLKRIDIVENKESITRISSFQINEISHNIFIDGEEIGLSPKEYSLFLYLIKNQGLILSRKKLIANVFEDDLDGDLRAIDKHIKKIKQALGNKANIIIEVRGCGYKLETKFQK